ncbi:helix-turn-helix domain-containing protein, partial [Shewanella algae]
MVLDLVVFWRNQLDQSTPCVSTELNKKGIIWGFPRREGFSYREIGKRLKVSHSTISREVNRNRIRDNHYLPEVAQAK